MLKISRLAMKLSQSEMASLMGMNQSSYNRIEKGHRQLTKQQTSHLNALLLLHKHGLIPELCRPE